MTLIAAVTAAHPYWSGIGIWIGCSVIAAGLWALCKVRDEDDQNYARNPGDATSSGHLTIVIQPPAAPGLLSERRHVS